MMNENFFGKYSVFCVFGSVVGCVVVPLIAQVLQHQSMECMILSAIFLTLTAAHLKKGGSATHHSKLLIARDYDRKKFASHSAISNKKQKSANSQSNHHKQQQQQNHHHHHHQHHEEEYIQQYEHLKILEMERRNEEKRLKKQKKREERLKKKEEETRKLKEEEERRATREKRKKKKDSLLPENHHRNINNPYHQAITNTYEKYCCGETTRFSSSNTRKHRTNSQDGHQFLHTKKHQQQGYITKRQNIPRFNNARKNNSSFDGNYVRSNSESLSINCSSSLSTSCSSLSSIGSSGSCSPPPPPCSGGSVWKTSGHYSDSDSTKSLSPHKYDSNATVLRQQELRKSWTLNSKIAEEPTATPQSQRVIKSYTNVRPVRSKFPAYNFNSSSLFCSSPEESCSKDLEREDVNKGGEYSLFGTHQFGNTFIKSPII